MHLSLKCILTDRDQDDTIITTVIYSTVLLLALSLRNFFEVRIHFTHTTIPFPPNIFYIFYSFLNSHFNSEVMLRSTTSKFLRIIREVQRFKCPLCSDWRRVLSLSILSGRPYERATCWHLIVSYVLLLHQPLYG